MTTIELLTNAADELYRLKQHATENEFSRLFEKPEDLYGRDVDSCIYGRATGSCYSRRATELIRLCARPPFFQDNRRDAELSSGLNLDAGYVRDRNFTALELALTLEENRVIKMVKELAEAEFPTA